MTRPLRIDYPDALYHVTCRGNERKEIFRDDHDRSAFLEKLQSSLEVYALRLHAYVLMNNHFHLVLQTPKANLSEFMRQFNVSYTGYHNRRHQRAGHLYQGRFKAVLVEADSYLLELSRYVHLNPVRVGSIKGIRVRSFNLYLFDGQVKAAGSDIGQFYSRLIRTGTRVHDPGARSTGFAQGIGSDSGVSAVSPCRP